MKFTLPSIKLTDLKPTLRFKFRQFTEKLQNFNIMLNSTFIHKNIFNSQLLTLSLCCSLHLELKTETVSVCNSCASPSCIWPTFPNQWDYLTNKGQIISSRGMMRSCLGRDGRRRMGPFIHMSLGQHKSSRNKKSLWHQRLINCCMMQQSGYSSIKSLQKV